VDDIPSLRALADADPLVSGLVAVADDVTVALVGGVVRDALLDRAPTTDVDVVVEGPAIPVARRLAERTGAALTTHDRFGTAVVRMGDGRHLDLVTARRETYAHPGALPTVTPGTLADDLARRDFTVNAMAYTLDGPSPNTVVDPHGGRDDLARRRIRILHDASFVDDPSRLLRAVRYAARLGFTLDPGTERAARAAAPHLTLESARVTEELRRLLEEDSAGAALELARDLGVPWIAPGGDLGDRVSVLAAAVAHPHAPSVALWAVRLGVAVRPDERRRAPLDASARSDADGVDAADALVAALGSGGHRGSDVDRILRRTAPSAQVVALARGAGAIADWWATIRDMELAVNGDDVIAAGVAPGPAVGGALEALRGAVIDGEVGPARDDQLAHLARGIG